ncbi:MAG TPA: S9 family peptidase [Terriglobales bacterium]|jgi:dipeptidyl aminopeptidase/acylaminoacyl peptidase|nr:S9 family peptidase [Terriglobales bacterium]
MLKLLSFATVFLCSSSLLAQSVSPSAQAISDPKQITSKVLKREVRPLSIEKLYTTRNIGATSWSPDDKTVAFITNISGRNNIWLIPSDGGWPSQLTISDQRQIDPVWSPNGKWIAFGSDHDGDEQWDLFIVSPLTGEVVNLTNTPDVAEEGAAWSPDSRYIAYMSKPRSSSTFEINIMDVLTKRYRPLTKNTPKELGNFGPLWSRDGKWIAYTQGHATGKDSNIFVADANTGKATRLTPHSDEHTYEATAFSPDGKYLLITSNTTGYENAGLLEIATKKIEWLTNEKWEVASGSFSPEGRQVTWTANVDGNTEIFVYDISSKQTSSLPLPKGVNGLAGGVRAFSSDGRRLLYYHNGPASPNDVWSYDFPTKESKQLTHSLLAGLSVDDMVEPFLVHYPSRDGKWQISALVYVPHNAPRDQTHPAIVYVHGGPTSQTVNSFNRIVQYLANQGYLLIAPNYRGSTGYGKEFMDANRFDMGGGDLQDVLAAADWVKQTGYVDPKKMVIMGGSYGGYMSMMALTKSPETWAAGVPIVPFVNWFTEVQNEDPLLREYDLATMGDPVKNKALWEDRSPINFVDRVKAPVLLLAGGNDPRCPKSEAQQVADVIKKRGGIVEFKVYENEGHGFARVENQIDAYTRVAEFLKKYVPAPPCGCTL